MQTFLKNMKLDNTQPIHHYQLPDPASKRRLARAMAMAMWTEKEDNH